MKMLQERNFLHGARKYRPCEVRCRHPLLLADARLLLPCLLVDQPGEPPQRELVALGAAADDDAGRDG